MASAHRRLRERVGSQSGVALIDAAAARSECEERKREWVLNCQYWRHELQSASGRPMGTKWKLWRRRRRLKSQVSDLKAQVALLKSRPEEKATDPWGFSEFLQQNSEITGSWERLQALLMFYQKDAVPPETWDTVITVTAIHRRNIPPLDFHKRFAEVKAERAKEEAAKKSRVLDLMRSGGGLSGSGGQASGTASPVPKPTPTPRYLQYSDKPSPGKSPGKSSGKPRPQKVQRRPSAHRPGVDLVQPASAKPR
ncbi:hypothetical protein V7S43_011205 [Phytophthora oleae]|uniref:Uncharacterized protein n=1 Tax=Phytophthora oleae TaxID=2107226 RepID=A0ABD3FDJ9_9STRA